MQVQPYLFFNGRCEEALEFYRTALGAEIGALMRFKDNPDPQAAGCGPDSQMPGGQTMDPEKVMHADFRVGQTQLMASDGMAQGEPRFEGISLALSPSTEAEADRLFAALAEGGQVQMPMARTFFSPRFGVVADRFGVSWMIVVSP
jgi:PhnB protein